MKKILQAVLLAVTLAVAAVAQARTSVPVINHENVVISPASGKKLSGDEVKTAIVRAAQKQNWLVADAGDRKIVATLNVQGKHTAIVDISYAEDKFSVVYKDSTNLNAASDKGLQVIHPGYNVWVKRLVDAINLEINKL